MKKVIIKTHSRNFPAFIGNNAIKFLPQLLEEFKLPNRLFVIVDKKVAYLHNTTISKVLKSVSGKVHINFLSASEKIKSFKTAQEIFSKLANEKFSRDTTLIAMGGGTIGDVAGFIASTYMRGVHLVHIPTTILSAVDSSIGGKTAINFKGAKNLIGTFYQPSFVLTDLNFLSTLPQREVVSGIGEIVKYSYLTVETLYSDLLSNSELLLSKDLDYFEKIILECVKLKAAVVSKDEREISGLRKILNFGHTFAHAFESNYNYKISHGKAVMIGIISAIFLSRVKGLINENQLSKMTELPLKFKPFLKLKNFREKDIFSLMSYDKKSRDGKMRFVLIKNFGETLIDIEAKRTEIYKSISETRKLLV